MNTNYYLLIGLIFATVLISGCIQDIEEEPMEKNATVSQESTIGEIEKSNLLISSSSVQGMFDATYLFYDGSFLHVNTLPWGDPQKCVEGSVPKNEYDSLMEFVKSSGFLDIKIAQKNERNILCEGTYSVEVKIGDRVNSLSLPCVSEYTESTKRVESIMRNVSTRLNEVINSSKQPCRQGEYIQTYKLSRTCAEEADDYKKYTDEELKYDVYEFSDLDANLRNSLENEPAIIYVGPTDKLVESYHRKYYSLGDSCYFVLLYEFDGNLFKSYDDKSR